MPATTAAALMQMYDDRLLIRKPKRVVCVIAPRTVALPPKLTGTTSAIESLSADWKGVGIVSNDGFNFTRETEKDDIQGFGYASPVRSDIISVNRSVTFTPLEYGRRHMLELELGQDLSGVTQDANGEIAFDEAEMPNDVEYRLLVIGFDGPPDDEWIFGKGYGTAKLANTGEEVWGSEGARSRELTLDIFNDETLGTPTRHYLGGTGAKKAAAKLGFTA